MPGKARRERRGDGEMWQKQRQQKIEINNILNNFSFEKSLFKNK